jgi:hypothetical protein
MLREWLDALAAEERPMPPAHEVVRRAARRGSTVTEAELRRGFIPHGSPRRRTLHSYWFLDRRPR